MNKPLYDLIIDVETMAKMNKVMDFAKMEVTLDQNKIPMRPTKSFLDSKAPDNFHRDH